MPSWQNVNFLWEGTNLNNLRKFKQPSEANQDCFLARWLASLALNLQKYQRAPLAPQHRTGCSGREPQLPATRSFQRGSQKWELLVSAKCPKDPGKRAKSDTLLSCWATAGTPTPQSMKGGFLLFCLASFGKALTDSQMLGFTWTLMLSNSCGYFTPQPDLHPCIFLTEYMSLFQPWTAIWKQIYCIYYLRQPKTHYYCSRWHRKYGHYCVLSVLLYHFIT